MTKADRRDLYAEYRAKGEDPECAALRIGVKPRTARRYEAEMKLIQAQGSGSMTTTTEPTTADLSALLADGVGQDRAASILGLTRNDVRRAAVALYEARARQASLTASPPPPRGPACEGMDPALFFGRDGERSDEQKIREERAKAVCAGCPVRERCLEAAMARPEKYGVFGGLNEDERAELRKRQGNDRRNAARRVAARRAQEDGLAEAS